MEQHAERELVRRLRTGDAAAFDVVHAEFNARLFNFLARLARSRDVAEDLVEETWLRVVRHVEKLRPDTRLGPWLFTIARNLHVSYCRSRALEESCTASAIGLWPAGLGNSPFEQTAASEFERRLEASLARLPVSYREVLLLVAIEGLRPGEAARVCGVSPEALRQRLKRARTMLAHYLDEASPLATAVAREVSS